MSRPLKKAVFLDRDGVLNRSLIVEGKPLAPLLLSEIEILPKVPFALKLLKDAGFFLIVITNQPDVAKGKTSRKMVEQIHTYLASILPLNDIRTCFHQDDDRCLCRKPLPGAILDAANYHQIDLESSFMVGDRWRDIEAGQRAGCKTFFIDYKYSEQQPTGNYVKVNNLLEATNIILGS